MDTDFLTLQNQEYLDSKKYKAKEVEEFRRNYNPQNFLTNSFLKDNKSKLI